MRALYRPLGCGEAEKKHNKEQLNITMHNYVYQFISSQEVDHFPACYNLSQLHLFFCFGICQPHQTLSVISKIITFNRINSIYVIVFNAMCITFFCIEPKTNSIVKFMMAFNRQEKTHRDTLAFQAFQEDQNIYGGRDLVSGGTWLGVNIETGVLVFLTNYDLLQSRHGQSRGKLVYSFLKTAFIPASQQKEADQILFQELSKVALIAKNYSAFNLTVCNLRTRKTFYLCSERGFNEPAQLHHGIAQGICNSDILQIWPKTALGTQLFSKIVEDLGKLSEQQVFLRMKQICHNKTRYSQNDDDQSSIFVKPYFCKHQQTQRRTKSTFLLLMKQKENNYELILKEITYRGVQMNEDERSYTLLMTK